MIQGKAFELPKRCPKCNSFKREGFEGKGGKRPAVLGLYTRLVDGGHVSPMGYSKNMVGWICRNCGAYKIEIEVTK